jgi:DNA-binding NarL/FixJ family response regulator
VERAPTGAARVLVAVPDDLYRVGVVGLLGEAGVEVVGQVDSISAAAELTRRLSPDVVLVELRAPRVGPLAIARLRQSRDTMSVLAMSASPTHAEALEALAAGASGYLPKYADADWMAAAIRAVNAGEVLMPWYVADAMLAPVREAGAPVRPEEMIAQPLSERELEVIAHVARGLTNEQIAGELVVTPSTVKNHLTRIVGKLGARNRTHAAVLAAQRRYV